MLAFHCWVWGLPLREVCIPVRLCWRKHFYLWVVVYWRKLWFRGRTPSGAYLFRPVHPAIFIDFICAPFLLCLAGLVFLVSSICTGSHTPSAFSSSWWKGFDEAVTVGLTVPSSLTLCIMSGCGPLDLFTSVLRGSFSEDSWARHWPMSRAECHSESFYCMLISQNSSLPSASCWRCCLFSTIDVRFLYKKIQLPI